MYVSVILQHRGPPIVPMKYIEWNYFQDMQDPIVDAVIAKFEEYKLK